MILRDLQDDRIIKWIKVGFLLFPMRDITKIDLGEDAIVIYLRTEEKPFKINGISATAKAKLLHDLNEGYNMVEVNINQ